MRTILAVGSQNISNAMPLTPLEPGLEIVGSSSDHTIVDVMDSEKEWKSGNTITFQVRYANMFYSLTGSPVSIEYCFDKK